MVFLGCILPCLSADEPADHVGAVAREVRVLVPPQIELDPKYIGQKFVGFRPYRKGGPRLEIEQRVEQIIAHNYGHGGTGWTMAPGCAQKIVKDLLAHAQEKAGDAYNEQKFKAQPVSVLGAGVIGSFTAYELWTKGFTNVSIVADKTKGLASDVSGGLIGPARLLHENGPGLEQVLLDTYRVYDQIYQGTHPHFHRGVRRLPAYFRTEGQSGFAPYVDTGLMDSPKKVTLRFPKKDQDMMAYDDALFVDSESIMHDLHHFLTEHGIRFEVRRVTALGQLKKPIVVNATGLGVLSLTDVTDEYMTSVQGHLMMLRNQPPEVLDYMIFEELEAAKTATGVPYQRVFFWLPKRVSGPGEPSHGVVGGSFIPDASSADDHLVEIIPDIFDQAQNFFGLS